MESQASSSGNLTQREEPAADDSPADSTSSGSPPESKDASKDLSKDASQDPSTEVEIGGRGGLDPTRYGDWEKNGRCIDF